MRNILTLTAICLFTCYGAIAQLSGSDPVTKPQIPKSTLKTVNHSGPASIYSGPAYLGTVKPTGIDNRTTLTNSAIPPSFPVKVNTGDPLKDEETYRLAKEQWIRENPGKYEEIVKQQQTKK